MTKVSLRSGVATLALAALVAAGMTAAPVSLSDDFGLEAKTAEAKNGKGGGNDKGGRGGNDKGGRGGNDKGGNGGSNGNSANAGSNKSSLDAAEEDIDTAEVEDEEYASDKKKGMGSLSASNSSQRARERASPNSRPGALGEYERALEEGDIEAAAAALARAANKEITPENVGKVNSNMGIESTPEEDAEMAALAEAARTADPDAEGEPEGEEAVAEGEGTEGEGSSEEGLDEIAAAAEELLGGEDADDWEVH